MDNLVKAFVLTLVYTFIILFCSFAGWWILDEFNLSFATWFGITIVTHSIIRGALVMESIAKRLNEDEVAPPVDRRGIL